MNTPPSIPFVGGPGRGRPGLPRYYFDLADRTMLKRDFGTFDRAYEFLFSLIIDRKAFYRMTAEGQACGVGLQFEKAEQVQNALDDWRERRTTMTVAQLAEHF